MSGKSVCRVLIAEDDWRSSQVLKRHLEEHGHLVTVVHDGRVAIEVLMLEDFDAVILDLMMPFVDGYEVLAWIRSDQEKCRTRVALMTAQADWHRSAENAHLVDRFIAKPVDEAAILTFLETAEPRTTTVRQGQDP